MKELSKAVHERKIKSPISKSDPRYTPMYPVKLSKEALEGTRLIRVTLPKGK